MTGGGPGMEGATPRAPLSFFLSPFLSRSLSFSLSHTHTLTLTHTHSHTQELQRGLHSAASRGPQGLSLHREDLAQGLCKWGRRQKDQNGAGCVHVCVCVCVCVCMMDAGSWMERHLAFNRPPATLALAHSLSSRPHLSLSLLSPIGPFASKRTVKLLLLLSLSFFLVRVVVPCRWRCWRSKRRRSPVGPASPSPPMCSWVTRRSCRGPALRAGPSMEG